MLERSHGKIKLPVSYFDWIKRFGSDFGYMPTAKPDVKINNDEFDYNLDRVDTMRRRLRKGMPLFSSADYTHGTKKAHEFAPYTTDPEWTTWRGDETEGIEVSSDGQYVYRKWRVWAANRPMACFVGLFDDNSIDDKKDEILAMSHGCGGFQRVNLFAKRLNRLQDLWSAEDPIGSWNDRAILLATLLSSYVVLCWGKPGAFLNRSACVMTGLQPSVKAEKFYWYGATESYRSDSGVKFVQPVGIKSVDYGAPLNKVEFRFIERINDE